MTEYLVEANRSGEWWAVTVPDLPGVFTQARRLDQVGEMARGAIAMFLDVDPASVQVTMRATPPASVADLIDRMQRAAAATTASAEATAARKRVARVLREEGLPLRDVGVLLGISHQRVSQILDEDDRD